MDWTQNNLVLVIENNLDVRMRLRRFLESFGCNVIDTDNGESALKIALSKSPNLILIDLGLTNGLELLHRIRRKKELSRIPILANSADGNHGINLFLNIDKLGEEFIGYLTKPISLRQLADQIDLILKKNYSRSSA